MHVLVTALILQKQVQENVQAECASVQQILQEYQQNLRLHESIARMINGMVIAAGLSCR